VDDSIYGGGEKEIHKIENQIKKLRMVLDFNNSDEQTLSHRINLTSMDS